MRRKRLLIMLGCAVAVVVAGVVVWCVRRPKTLYRVTLVPSLGGVEAHPYAINDAGRVVAAVRMADGTERVILWDKSGRTEDLACLPAGHGIWTLALNNAGQVAGTVNDPNHVASSFFWDADGSKYTLDPPAAGQVRIEGLNNRGQVVGHWGAARGPEHAFIWEKTNGMQDLGTFGGLESCACDINDRGQIVGFFSTRPNDWRAFLCDPNLGLRDLGPAPFGSEGACCINDHGFVVGQFGSARDQWCVSTWTAASGPQRLSSLGGDCVQVRGLDDAGRYFLNVSHEGFHVLGRQFGERAESHLWESGRRVRCLNDCLGRTDIQYMGVCDINKGGTILAHVKVKGLADSYPVLLEPVE